MAQKIDDIFNNQQYKKHLRYYLESNTDEHVGGGNSQERVDFLTKYLPSGSHIFEIGSGGGTDAFALQENGFIVTASDFVDAFVEILQKKNLPSIIFDAKKDMLPEGFDALYANAVFVHFLPSDLKKFLYKAKAKLVGNKIIFFSVISGEGTERKVSKAGFDRDFQYYTEAMLRKILSEKGYKILEIKNVDKWIQVISQAV